MKKGRALEWCKTIIIVLLLLSILLLSLSAFYYTTPTSVPLLQWMTTWFSEGTSQPPRLAQEPALTDAAQPLLISTLSASGRTSAWGDFESLDSAFETLGAWLAEALDTAGEPEAISLSRFQTAVLTQGAYFRYPGDVPLEVLAAWLDADMTSDLAASQLFLQICSSTVRLLVCGEAGCWEMDTQLESDTLLSALPETPSDGTVLAGESADDRYAHLDPLTLLDGRVTALPAAQASNPCDEAFLTATATALGFNPYGDATYQDDASTIFTETDCSLRIGADGLLTLTNQGLASRFSAASADDGDRIEYVRSLLETLAGSRTGDARLQFTGISQEDGLTTVTFHYFLRGLPVEHPDGPAVTAEFSGATLSTLSFRLRCYTLSATEEIGLLPAAQAAVLQPDGSMLTLAYGDNGGEQLSAGWLK